MAEPTHIEGRKSADIFVYALSTCGWCKKTKALLNELGVAYDYIDVDLLEDGEREEILKEIAKWNPSRSFPTVVINGDRCLVGFKETELKEAVAQ